jgi:hypothetical protein
VVFLRSSRRLVSSKELLTMKRLMFNILCLVVFLAGLATYSRTKSTDVEVARSYVVIMEHFRISANGSRTELASRIIYGKANGEMRQTGYDPNNGQDLPREAPSVARLEEGLFATASGVAERNLISSTAVPPEMQQCFRSADEMVLKMYCKPHQSSSRTCRVT